MYDSFVILSAQLLEHPGDFQHSSFSRHRSLNEMLKDMCAERRTQKRQEKVSKATFYVELHFPIFSLMWFELNSRLEINKTIHTAYIISPSRGKG